MITTKSYTSLEQAKKLAEILPPESADMRFCFSHTLGGRVTGHYPMIGREPSMGTVPCWSLAALMDILDRGALFKTPKGWACQYYVEYKAITGNFHSNPVDACVEIILEIHKQKNE